MRNHPTEATVEATVRGGFPILLHLQHHCPQPGNNFASDDWEVEDVTTLRGGSAGFLKLTDREIEDALELATWQE